MQKKSIWMITILLLSAFVFAEEDTKAGITPDSALWGMDVAFDKISIGMTFNNEKKVEKELRVAEERLQEVREMISQNKLDKSEKAQREHSKMLESAQSDLDDVKDNDDIKQFEKELRLEQKINDHKEKALKLKLEIEGNLTEKQQAALDAFLSTLDENVNKLEIKIKNKGDETRLRVKTEYGEEKVEELEKDKWKMKAENEQKQAENEILKAEEKIKKFGEKGSSNENDEEDEKEVSSNSGKGMLKVTGEVSGSDNDDEKGSNEEDENAETDLKVEDDLDDERKDEAEDETKEESEVETEDEKEDLLEDETETEVETELEKEDLLEDEAETEDEGELKIEDEIENDGNVMAEFNLSLPDYPKKTVNSSLRYVADAKSALQKSSDLYGEGEYKAAYAYAKYAKKLAQKAMSGKYLGSENNDSVEDKAEDDGTDESELETEDENESKVEADDDSEKDSEDQNEDSSGKRE